MERISILCISVTHTSNTKVSIKAREKYGIRGERGKRIVWEGEVGIVKGMEKKC